MHQPPAPIDVLRRCQVMLSLSDHALQDIGLHSTMAVANRGEPLWIKGRDVDFFAAIEAGFVKMTRSTAQGVDVTTEIFGPNQVLGMLGTIKGSGCPQAAYAVCETHFLRISKERFLPYYRENMILKDHLIERTSDRLTRAHAMLTRMSTSRVEVRIAQVLLVLSESYGVPSGTGVRLSVPLTRQSIAEMAGTTVESTIRVMSQWQKQGVLKTESRQINLVNVARLEALLD